MCGIGAIYLKDQSVSSRVVPNSLINMLLKMQPRGQRSAGISVYNPRGSRILSHHKGLGLVNEVFCLSDASKLAEIVERNLGVGGIAQTRYSTSGNDLNAIDEVQPFERRHAKLSKRFSLGFNGNITNYAELKGWFLEQGYSFDTEVDTEVLMNLMARNIRELEKPLDGKNNPIDLMGMVHKTMTMLDGAYNVVSMFGDGNLLVFRDPQGFHPLVFGENSQAYAFASESSALEKIGIHSFEDVRPGEAFVVNSRGVVRKSILESNPKYCQFEYPYFARSQSKVNGIYVRGARFSLGRELAKTEPLLHKLDDSYLVVPAPWTAVPAAQEYAEELNLKFRLAIEKDGSVRGFINSASMRGKIIKNNYIVHREVQGKKIILFDDSLVRGDTSKELVGEVRAMGASEVHLRLTEPEIKFPCFYAIDFPTLKELGVNKFKGDLGALARELNADSMHFQSLEGLIRGIGLPSEKLCLACLNGQYPTPYGQKRFDEELTKA